MNGRETNRDMPRNCPLCGAVLPVSALDGLCPLHGSRRWMDEVVLLALENEPELRYQQASQVKSDVETIMAGVAAEGLVRAESTASKRYAVLSLVLFLTGTLGTLLLMSLSFAGPTTQTQN